MTRRSEAVIIVYTISLVLLGFCQFMHEAYDPPASEPITDHGSILARATELPR